MGDQSVRIGLVGHCRPDTFAISGAVRDALGEVELVSIDSDSELVGAFDLLLVNRVLFGSFGDESGIRLIEELSSERRCMLVSNFAEAHEEAERVGGVPGFGKSELRSEKMKSALRSALGLED